MVTMFPENGGVLFQREGRKCALKKRGLCIAPKLISFKQT